MDPLRERLGSFIYIYKTYYKVNNCGFIMTRSVYIIYIFFFFEREATHNKMIVCSS